MHKVEVRSQKSEGNKNKSCSAHLKGAQRGLLVVAIVLVDARAGRVADSWVEVEGNVRGWLAKVIEQLDKVVRPELHAAGSAGAEPIGDVVGGREGAGDEEGERHLLFVEGAVSK